MARKSFLFDQDFCIGCKACEIACQVYHHQEPEITWRKVSSFVVKDQRNQVVEKKGNERDIFVSSSCNHCEDPACLKACPVQAFSIRKDGIVEINRDLCIGCGNCVEECPYGAISIGSEDKAQKCNMCAERQDRGEEPACVRACPIGVLQIVDTEVAEKAGMLKEIPGFEYHEETKSTTRFYPKYVPGQKRVDF